MQASANQKTLHAAKCRPRQLKSVTQVHNSLQASVPMCHLLMDRPASTTMFNDLRCQIRASPTRPHGGPPADCCSGSPHTVRRLVLGLSKYSLEAARDNANRPMSPKSGTTTFLQDKSEIHSPGALRSVDVILYCRFLGPNGQIQGFAFSGPRPGDHELGSLPIRQGGQPREPNSIRWGTPVRPSDRAAAPAPRTGYGWGGVTVFAGSLFRRQLKEVAKNDHLGH